MRSRNIYINLLLGIIYAIVYDYVYTNFMYNFFSYMYCPDATSIKNIYGIYILTATMPLIFYKGFQNIANGISLLVYLIIYIPMLYASYISELDESHKIQCIIALLLVTSLFFATDNLFLNRKWMDNPNKAKVPFEYLEIIGIIVFLIILLSEKHNLKFVNIWNNQDELYDLRSSYSSQRNAIVVYLLSWTKTAFLPLFVVYYLKTKKYIKLAIVLSCYMITFMIDMQKVTLLMPFLISMAYFGLNRSDIVNKFIYFVVGFLSILSSIIVYNSHNVAFFKLGSILIMRLQCLDSWLFSMYIDFFKNHPFTYYTHINFINAITHAYPYNEALGYAVSNGQMNANASFLITDGYASLGIMGFLIVGIIFIILKGIFNCTCLVVNKNHLIVILFPAISAMLNVSIFTAVLSCGFLLLYIILKYVDLSPLQDESTEENR